MHLWSSVLCLKRNRHFNSPSSQTQKWTLVHLKSLSFGIAPHFLLFIGFGQSDIHGRMNSAVACFHGKKASSSSEGGEKLGDFRVRRGIRPDVRWGILDRRKLAW